MRIQKLTFLAILILILSFETSFASLYLSGVFKGWKGNTVVELSDGSFWIQNQAKITECYVINPEARIKNEHEKTILYINGCDDSGVEVRKLSLSLKSRVMGQFMGYKEGNIYILENGQVLEQTDNYEAFRTRISPEVLVYEIDDNFYMQLSADSIVCKIKIISGTDGNSSDVEDNKSSYINVINNTDKVIFFCYAIYSGKNSWQSKGWYKIEADSENRINLAFYSGNAYLYAEFNGGDLWWGDPGSDHLFCIDRKNAFSIENADKVECKSSDNVKVKMMEVNIKPGILTWKIE